MITISLCMIVKNEERVLARCLKSVRRAVDEVVILDTGSTDGTREIAAKHADRLEDFVWEDDFSAARNAAFALAGCDYILWLDADDVLEGEEAEKLLRLKSNLPPTTDMVMMKYAGFGPCAVSYYRERLLRRAAGFRWEGAVHEAIPPRGVVAWSDITVTHRPEAGAKDPDRNLRIYRKLLSRGPLSPREQFYYGRELNARGEYAEAERVLTAFLGEGKGWPENEIAACRELALCRRALGNADGELDALLHSFALDAPRAEICCEVGDWFLRRGSCRKAAFWYETALTRPMDERGGGFVQPDCYEFLPCLRLCACWAGMGRADLARTYLKRAAACKPEDERVRKCREFPASLPGGEA